MGEMICALKGIEHEHATAGYFVHGFIRNGFGIRDIGEFTESEAVDRKAMVHDLYRGNAKDINGEVLARDFVHLELGNSRIVAIESIVKILLELVYDIAVAVYWHSTFLKEIECPHVVETCNVIAVLVCEQYGIQTHDSFAKNLLPEIRPGIYNHADAFVLDMKGCAQTPVALISRAANRTIAGNYGDAL